MNDIAPEILQLLAQRSGVQLNHEEIEPLCRVYVKLEQMKALIRKPRDHSNQLAHKFDLNRGKPFFPGILARQF